MCLRVCRLDMLKVDYVVTVSGVDMNCWCILVGEEDRRGIHGDSLVQYGPKNSFDQFGLHRSRYVAGNPFAARPCCSHCSQKRSLLQLHYPGIVVEKFLCRRNSRSSASHNAHQTLD